MQTDGFDKLSRDQRALWDIFLSGSGLFALLKTAADILELPVFLRAGTVYFVAPEGSGWTPDEGAAGRIMLWCSTHTGDSPQFISPLPDGIRDKLPADGLMCCPVILQGRSVGCLAVAGDSFDEARMQIITALSGMCAVLIGSNPFAADELNGSGAAVFRALLAGESVDPAILKNDAELLRASEGRSMQILAIDPRGAGAATLKSLRETCGTMISCGMRAVYRDFVVFLYFGRRKYPLSEHHNFLEYLRRSGCCCGLSREFGELGRASQYFEQARVSIELGQSLDPGQILYEYEDYAMEHSIIVAARQLPEMALISPRLGMLLDYDEAKNAGLVDTLRVYLENINNLNAAAEKLHVHRNTLFYRLRKIEDLTGWDLDSGRCLNRINFYLNAIRLENLL